MINDIGCNMLVSTNQKDIHPDLEKTVRKHFCKQFQKPIQRHNQEAFKKMLDGITGNKPFIFDSCCGVGESTINIAKIYPSHYVVGIDKSKVRINNSKYYVKRNKHTLKNFIIFRADVVDFWRLAVDAGIKLDHHYLLYPNPWPKKGQLNHRWHGHPVFPTLLKLGGTLHIRSNWKLYLEEFALAVQIVSDRKCILKEIFPLEPISSFERKYQIIDEKLFELVLTT